MVDLIKKQIVDRLSLYTKGLKAKDISLQFLSGKGQLKNLELNPDFLSQVLMFPPWLEVHSAKCDLIRCRVPFTKIRSEPIVVSINEIVVEVSTCSTETKKEKVNTKALQKMKQRSSGSYGIIDKAIDGMTIEIRSVQLRFTDPAFSANLSITEISIRSVPPPKRQASSLKDMFLKLKQEDVVLFYKTLTMHSLRIEGWGTSETDQPLGDPTLQLRLVMNETEVNLAVKRRIADTSVQFVKVVAHLGDLMWILTQSQLRSLSRFAQSLTETALKTFHQEREQQSSMHRSKMPMAAAGSKPATDRAALFEGTNLSHVTRWLQQIYQEGKKLMPEWEVIQHSIHLLTRDVNIQLCSDISTEDDVTLSSHITGSTLLHVENLEIDVYPDQRAGTGRCHWRRRNDVIDSHLSWARTLLSEANQMKVPITTSTGTSTPSSRVSESDGPPPRPEIPPRPFLHQRSIDDGPPPRPEPPPSSLLNRRSTSSAISYTPPMEVYSTEDLDDDDAVLITTAVEDLQLSGSISPIGSQEWRGSTASLQSLDVSATEGVKYSRVRMSQLHERSIVIRCKRYSIDALSTVDGKVSSLPFLRSDKDTFHIPDDVPAFQACITLYYYPGHTLGKDCLVPRPVIQVNLCPIHFILNQPTCLWLIDFVQGILRTVDFDLANRVRKDIEHTLRQRKEKKAALYPLPTALDGFHFKFRILYSKITLPVYGETSLNLPQDGRPVALQVETSEIKFSTLSKASLEQSQEFKDLMQSVQNGWLFSTSDLNAFPHVAMTDLPFLPRDCLSTILENQGITGTASTDGGTNGGGMKVAFNEAIGLSSPWSMACDCICIRFVHGLNEVGITHDTSPFVRDFPIAAWLFPGVTEVADTFSSGSDIAGDNDALPFPSMSALVHIRSPISGEITRPELMTCLRLKDSITQFKDGIIRRMLPMKEHVKADLARGGLRGSVSSEHSHSVLELVYAGGAVVGSGASFRLVLPPVPTTEDASTDTMMEDEKEEERLHTAQEPQGTFTETTVEECEGDVPTDEDPPTESSDGSGLPTGLAVNDCSVGTPADALAVSSSVPSVGATTEPTQEVVSLKIDVSGIEAIFTLSQPGITLKAGVHDLAVENLVVEGNRRESPSDVSDLGTVSYSSEPLLKARVELGDQVARLFSSDVGQTPNGLVRLEVSGLDLSMVEKHLASVAAFAQDEVPDLKPMPLEVRVKNTGFTLKQLRTSGPNGLKNVTIAVTEAQIVRGPKAQALYAECTALQDDTGGSTSTLADEVVGSTFPDTLHQNRVTVTHGCKEILPALANVEGTTVESRQDEELLDKFHAFVEEFQSYLARPGQPRMPRAPEFLALLDGMRTSLANVGHGEKQGESPPDYITAMRSNEEVMLNKLQELEKERNELQMSVEDLVKKTKLQAEEVGALEQSLVQCKLDLAQQKELVLDKEDKIKTLKAELGNTAHSH